MGLLQHWVSCLTFILMCSVMRLMATWFGSSLCMQGDANVVTVTHSHAAVHTFRLLR